MAHIHEKPDGGALLHAGPSPSAADHSTVSLPPPDTQRGKPLMQALRERQSSREYDKAQLPMDVLSNLLWAAVGINRAQSGGRTAPTAHEWNEIDVYVATADGLYLYDARVHTLRQVLARDVRVLTGMQSFVAHAPVNLVYVADYSRMVEAEETDRILYSAADAGAISQNVNLFCASEGLATVVRGLVARSALAKLMKLRPSQHVIVAQSVGYPVGVTGGSHV